jgi:hypothetical protein
VWFVVVLGKIGLQPIRNIKDWSGYEAFFRFIVGCLCFSYIIVVGWVCGVDGVLDLKRSYNLLV